MRWEAELTGLVSERLQNLKQDGGVCLVCGTPSADTYRDFYRQTFSVQSEDRIATPPACYVTYNQADDRVQDLFDDELLHVDVNAISKGRQNPPRSVNSDLSSGTNTSVDSGSVAAGAEVVQSGRIVESDGGQTSCTDGYACSQEVTRIIAQYMNDTSMANDYSGRIAAPCIICDALEEYIGDSWDVLEDTFSETVAAISRFGAIGYMMVPAPFSSEPVSKLSAYVDAIIVLRDGKQKGERVSQQQILFPGRADRRTRTVASGWITFPLEENELMKSEDVGND